MSQSLLEIANDLQALDDLLYELGGEVTVETAPQVESWMAELKANFDAKADGYAALVTTMEKRAEVRRDEAERLRRRAKVDEGAAEFLRARLKAVMEDRGIKKIETARFRISVAGNGGLAPLKIYDEKLIPASFFVPQPSVVDTQAIREALDLGMDVPGADYEPRGTSLRIK